MNIFVYSDESGVFDKVHNDIFVFGGLIIIETNSKQEWSRRYAAAEKVIRAARNLPKDAELKAANLSNKDKGKLFRSLNNCPKFGVVIDQKSVLDRIFHSKKDKQRYLDYAFKIGVKRAFEHLIQINVIDPNNVKRLYFCIDEHSTATNGHYELKEGLEQEFRNGTYNLNYNVFYPPIFTGLQEVQLQFCNSKTTLLVRAADIVANRIYFEAQKGSKNINGPPNIHITYLP